MKIAQVSPLYESVPPKAYGGTERVISYLTEELVAMGHEVTLYGSGDSVTGAQLRAMCNQSLRLDKYSIDPVADHILLAEKVFQEAERFDIVHSHIDYIPYSLYRLMKTPHITTLHGRLDIPNLVNLYKEFHDMPLISISNYQRLPLSWANWQATVPHGIPKDLYQFHEQPGDYLAFVGRICPEKCVDVAITLAQQVGMPLKIAAKVDNVDKEYFDTCIKELLEDDNVEFLGEINDREKNDFLGNARALLFPINWPEPFGLVMIEAMACGTPVIARLHGSVPEVIDQGVTGYVTKDLMGSVEAVKNLSRIDRRRCREVFEERFTSRRMAENYLKVYDEAVASKASGRA
ncbi:MAG: glycosyltransferase family 4 protein [Candidatus Omnitrophica bacterium]|nr:glycosyltransferase family 4 protein [Candidatus Omnitrophota bacterium]MDE2223479.1 glycosyltransferase family 4 protein [Candidatus Omnitrophota bacterium]